MTGLGTPKAAAIASSLSGDVDAPSLIAPAANSIVTTTTPTFQWSPVVGGSGYVLTVTDTTTGQQVITYSLSTAANGTAVTSYTPTTPLAGGDAYSWNVSAVTADGDAAVSPEKTLSFVIVPVPTPTGPSGVVDSTLSLLQWSAVGGAAGYEVNLEDVTTGDTVVTGLVVSSNSYTPTVSLNDLDTYSWSVSALSKAENNGSPYASPPSGSVYFTVNTDVAPVPITPENEASVTTTPTLVWSAVAGAVSYNVTIIDFSAYPYTPTVVSVTNANYSPTTSLANGYYQWSVQAFVSVNGTITPSPSSELSYFTLSQYAAPILISPQPGAVVATAFPTFQWSLNGNNSVNFSLFDITEGETVLPDLGLFSSSFTLDVPLDNGHTYQWAISYGLTGPSADFTVDIPGGGTQSLPAPTLIAPSGVISSNLPTFSWTAVPGAVDYALYISNNSAPVLVHGTSYTLQPTTVPPGLGSGFSFLWNVTAYDGSGDFSLPSPGLDFFVEVPGSAQLPAPTNLSPGGIVTTYTPTLTWSAVPGATSYGISLYDETAGSLVTDAGLGDQTNYPIEFNGDDPPLLNGHTYRWYVLAVDDTGNETEFGAVATEEFSVLGPSVGPPTQTYARGRWDREFDHSHVPVVGRPGRDQLSVVPLRSEFRIRDFRTVRHTRVGYFLHPEPPVDKRTDLPVGGQCRHQQQRCQRIRTRECAFGFHRLGTRHRYSACARGQWDINDRHSHAPLVTGDGSSRI